MKNRDWKKDIAFVIESSGFKCCRIVDTEGNKVSNWTEASPVNLTKKVIDFLDYWEKDRYHLQFRLDKTSTWSTEVYEHSVDTRAKKEQEENPKTFEQSTTIPIQGSMQNTPSYEDIEARAVKRAEEIANKLILEHKIKQYEEQKEQLNGAANQASYMLGMIGKNLINNLLANKNNIPMTQNVNGQGNNLTHIDNLLEESQEQIKKELDSPEVELATIQMPKDLYFALEKIMQHMDLPTFEAFANRIEKDPSVVNTLKSFL